MPRGRAWVVVLFAGAVAVTTYGSTAASGGAAAQAACGKVLPPSDGMYFGAMGDWTLNPTTGDDVIDMSALDSAYEFESSARRGLVLLPFNVSWAPGGLAFPSANVKLIWRSGFVPELRLFNFPMQEWMAGAPPPPGPTPNSSIAAGEHDSELRSFADAARATDIPILLTYDSEATAPSHPWSPAHDGGGVTNGYGDPSWPDGPEHFRDAYRRIVTIFREEGATNVSFVFHVNAVSGYLPGGFWEPWNRYRYSYPGDDYMDWIGLSVYAEPKFLVGPPEGFEDVLAFPDIPGYEGPYAEITALGSRPLILNEVGIWRMPSEQSKADWVAGASSVLQSGRYPRVKAMNWWGQTYGDYGGWPGTSSTFRDAFQAAFDPAFFGAKPQFSGDCTPLPPAQPRLRGRLLTWRAVPNAASYEVWRGAKRLGVTQGNTFAVRTTPGAYRVRGRNIAGNGAFSPPAQR